MTSTETLSVLCDSSNLHAVNELQDLLGRIDRNLTDLGLAPVHRQEVLRLRSIYEDIQKARQYARILKANLYDSIPEQKDSVGRGRR